LCAHAKPPDHGPTSAHPGSRLGELVCPLERQPEHLTGLALLPVPVITSMSSAAMTGTSW
jgi:hypothetical protein